MWYFATLTLVYLVDLNLLCQNNYLLLLLAIPVNAGMATARQATSAAQHHCGVWLVASYTIQKSHIVTRENVPPFFCRIVPSFLVADSNWKAPYGIRIFCLNLIS